MSDECPGGPRDANRGHASEWRIDLSAATRVYASWAPAQRVRCCRHSGERRPRRCQRRRRETTTSMRCLLCVSTLSARVLRPFSQARSSWSCQIRTTRSTETTTTIRARTTMMRSLRSRRSTVSSGRAVEALGRTAVSRCLIRRPASRRLSSAPAAARSHSSPASVSWTGRASKRAGPISRCALRACTPTLRVTGSESSLAC